MLFGLDLFACLLFALLWLSVVTCLCACLFDLAFIGFLVLLFDSSGLFELFVCLDLLIVFRLDVVVVFVILAYLFVVCFDLVNFVVLLWCCYFGLCHIADVY